MVDRAALGAHQEPRDATDVKSAVEDLALQLDDPALDDASIDACRKRLDALRGVYRRQPELFEDDIVVALKALAAKLRPRRADPQDVLRETFGYSTFRRGQREIIDAVLAGRDCVGVMPTGAGKSLTFQIPARVLGGTTLVISPLIALMKDQVDALEEAGFRATFLNSSIPLDERARRMARIAAGELELVYMAPEGLQASAGRALGSMPVSLVAIDEAHCISHWGHDFRPAYRTLAGLKRRFPRVPVLALTATATGDVVRDIVEQLGMFRPLVHRGSFFRPNLHLHAFKKGGDDPARKTPPVRDAILEIVRQRPGESGIVYCLSRKSTETTCEYLREHGVRAAAYHAGMEPEARAKAQDGVRNDEVDVVVATIAFGMGIDKSNVRYVVHRDMPRSIEGYYQEVGRAGRDGLPSDCILFYSWSEVVAYDRFAEEGSDEVAARMAAQAREMFRFAESRGCRHRTLVGYFGEDIAACETSCDICGAPPVALRPSKAGRVKATASSVDGQERELFDLLKSLRRHIAETKGVPAYVVFSDATLVEMAKKHPTTEAELRAVSGIGPRKLEAYGEAFLRVLREEARGRR